MNARRALVTLFALVLSAGYVHADPTILQDTFESGTVGQPPGSPEVGTVQYSGAAHEVVPAPREAKRLLSYCVGDPEGVAATWYPADLSSTRVRVSYRASLHATSGSASEYYRRDDIAWQRTSDLAVFHFYLYWWGDGTWRTHSGEVLGAYSEDTIYNVSWILDSSGGPVELRIDGVSLLADLSIDPGGLIWSRTRCNPDGLIDITTDELRAVEEPIFSGGFDLESPDEWSDYSPVSVLGDECALPGVLGQGIDTPGTLAGYSGATGDDSSCGSGDTIDHWYHYTAQCNGTATLSTCLPGTAFDTVVAVYDGCGGSELACNDDAVGDPAECQLLGSNRMSIVSFPAVAGASYPVRVSAPADDLDPPFSPELALRAECTPSP